MRRKPKFRSVSHELTSSSCVTVLLCVTTLVCLCDGLVHDFNYTEVEKFGNACPRLDSCSHLRSDGRRQLTSFRESNCACDYLCPQYGDCCVDAPARNATVAVGHRPKCYDLKQFGGVYMRDACPASYTGPEDVRHLCEDSDPNDRSDPLGSMPATDSKTGLTYKNYYCSMCDDGSKENVVLWTPRLECPLLTLFNSSRTVITDGYVVQNLATDGQGWGLFLEGENGSLFFHDCDVDPVIPRTLEAKVRLCKSDLVSDCPQSWTDESVRAMCRTYMGAKYVHGGEGYRNVHCALCNGINVTHLSCQSAEVRGIDIFRTFGTHSFALLLDINEKRGHQVGKVKMCQNGEVFDPFFKKCRSLTCLPGFVQQGRKCSPAAGFSPVASTEEPVIAIRTELTEDNYDSSNVTYVTEIHLSSDKSKVLNPFSGKISSGDLNLSSGKISTDLNLSSGKSYNVSDDDDVSAGKFLDCLLISLAPGDYVMLPNRTIFVPKYDKLYEPTSYHASDGSVLVCTHFTSEHDAKFLPLLGYVTLVGLGISMLFLILHFAAFCLVPDLRNLSGKNLVSQCLALFFAYLCFMAGQFESLAPGPCVFVGFLTFYFFQASFFWMAVMAYDIWRTLKMATTELRVSSGRQSKRFLFYSLFTWTIPLFLLLLLILSEYTDLFSAPYKPGFSRAPCWFKQRRSLLVFFATPLFAIMLANVVLFLASARMIVMTSVTQQSRLQRRNFKLYLRLALLMGLTWVAGLVAGYFDSSFLFYMFVVLNTLQGLFIFVAFTCTSKVLGYLKNKFKSRPKEFKSSSCSNSTGSAFSTKPTTLIIRN